MRKFPVFFRVSRNLVVETGSNTTASSTIPFSRCGALQARLSPGMLPARIKTPQGSLGTNSANIEFSLLECV
jgi:hypothetical protein